MLKNLVERSSSGVSTKSSPSPFLAALSSKCDGIGDMWWRRKRQHEKSPLPWFLSKSFPILTLNILHEVLHYCKTLTQVLEPCLALNHVGWFGSRKVRLQGVVLTKEVVPTTYFGLTREYMLQKNCFAQFHPFIINRASIALFWRELNGLPLLSGFHHFLHWEISFELRLYLVSQDLKSVFSVCRALIPSIQIPRRQKNPVIEW